MSDSDLTVYERIRKLRKTVLCITQDKFAKSLGVSRSNIGNIEVGRINVTDRVLQDICDKYNVSMNWLNTGKGDMFVHEELDLLVELTRTYNLKSKEIAIVKAFLELSEAGRAGVLEYIEKANNNIAQSRQSRAEIIAKDIETTEKILIQSQLKKSSDNTEN